jgi:dTDP-4-amino-4,6-dideoxygalactose transaminase
MAYKVPFVDFPKQYKNIEKELSSEILRIMANGDFILRSDVSKFENNIANYVGVKYAVGVNSGTDALLLSLLACGIGKEDEVITVSHTFVATISVIVHCGATPVLVDVGYDYNMDTDLIERAITPKTKSIIPVHLNGRVCNMDRLMKIAGKYNLLVIEDAAQALGAKFNGKKAGSFGIAGCFSFYPAKCLGGAGDGGIVVTNDEQVAEKVRLYRDHGRQTKEDIALFGFTSRLDNLQATILNVKFKYIEGWIEKRRKLAKIYQEGLHDVSQLQLPPPPSSGMYFDTYQNYVIRAGHRDALYNYLTQYGIETIISNRKPNHLQEHLNLSKFKLQVTEQLSKDVISIPLIPEISEEQVEYVIQTIRDFYRKSK